MRALLFPEKFNDQMKEEKEVEGKGGIQGNDNEIRINERYHAHTILVAQVNKGSPRNHRLPNIFKNGAWIQIYNHHWHSLELRS